MSTVSDYNKYRGRCKEMCDEAIKTDLTLTLVRGHYYCPIWDRDEEHWWTVRADGSIYDPTVLQFPSKGLGVYTPFNGTVESAQCGKEMKERDVERAEGRYAFCSYRCHGRFVGVF